MPAYLLAQCSIPKVTNVAEDTVVNTFAFIADVVDASNLDAIDDAVRAFYNMPDGVFSATALSAFLAPRLSRVANACEINVYNVSANLGAIPASEGGVVAGSPIQTTTFTLGAAAGGQTVPEEVALCLTLRDRMAGTTLYPAEGPANTRPRKRHAGRVYVGPFGSNALAEIASDARPSNALMSAMLGAGNSLFLTTVGSGVDWAIWSRASATMFPVDAMEVDNAWDTMRSRGIDPSQRNVAALPYP